MTRDLPDDMIDAEPSGGWAPEGGAASSTDDDAPSPADEAGRGENEERDDSGGARSAEPVDATEDISDPFVESAEIQQGLDPDLVTDAQAERDEEAQR